MTVTCPSREELEAFSLGKLPDDTIESIAGHLEACPTCEDTVLQLDDRADTFLENLQGPTPEDPFADESACSEAVAAAKAVAAESSPTDQPPVDAQAESLGRIGEYQLLAKLGHGGMGTVYRALHTRMRRVVALKVLTTHQRHDPAVVERFLREIEAVGKLSHPNIVTAHDAGEEDGMHYLVMELVEGVDLHTLVSQHGPLPVADACEIIRQAALGLQHAHEHGLVHRDLKPSNLMLAKSGERRAESLELEKEKPSALSSRPSAQVKLLDLGLALLQGDHVASEHITATGQVMGTLDYMAPEQADDSHGVDVRADIYALGCTFHKLLTGHAPFSGTAYNSPARKILAHAQTAPPSIRETRPEVPESLAALLERMLAKSPDDRPATPADLAAALEPLCAGCDLPGLVSQVDALSQSEAYAASQGEIAMMLPTPKPRSRRPSLGSVIAVAASLVFFAVAVGAVVITIRRGDGPGTVVKVPEGSHVQVGEEGQVAVTLSDVQSSAAGQAVNGLVVSLAVSSRHWNPGDEIELVCSFKNTSDEPIHVPNWGRLLPAIQLTKHVETHVAANRRAPPVATDKMQLPQAPVETLRKQILQFTFTELLPGKTKTITHRGVLDKNGLLAIRWPTGITQTWNLQDGQFRLEAILDSHSHKRSLAELAREGGIENVWYGKTTSGGIDVTVSGVPPKSVDPAGDEPTYAGKPLSYWAATLKDPNPDFRRMALRPLLSFGPAGAEALLDLLRSGDRESKLLILSAFEEFGPDTKGALPALIDALDDPHGEVRYSALGRFAEFGSDAWFAESGSDTRDAIPALIAALDSPDDRVRVRATNCLARFGGDARDALPALIQALNDPHDPVRCGAAICLAKFGSYALDALPALIQNLDDSNVSVRYSAAVCLSKFGSDAADAIPALLRMLDDSEPVLRQAAVWGLGKIGVQSEKVVSALIRVAGGHDRGAQIAAVCMLGEFPNHAEKIIPVLRALVTDSRGVPKPIRFGDPAGRGYDGPDRKFLSREEWRRFSGVGLPGAAMLSLVRLDGQEYSKILEYSRHSRQDIRQAAVHCLSYIDGRKPIERLIAMLDDTDDSLTWFVRLALRRVARTRSSQLLAALNERDRADQISVGLDLATHCHASFGGPVSPGFEGAPFAAEDAPEWLPPARLQEAASKAIAAGVTFALRFLRQTDISRDRHDELLLAAGRSQAVIALGLLDADQARQVLPPLLQTEKLPEVRNAMVEVLRFLGEEVSDDDQDHTDPNSPADEPTYSGKPLSHWVEQLKDRDPEYRTKAVTAVVSFGPSGAGPLVEILQTGDPESKRLALSGLRQLVPEAGDVLPAVIAALDDPDKVVRAHAATCVGRFGHRASEAVPKLLNMLKDERGYAHDIVAWTLWHVRSEPEKTVPALIEAARDYPLARGAAAYALGDFPEQAEQSIPVLRELVGQDTSPNALFQPYSNSEVNPFCEFYATHPPDRSGLDSLTDVVLFSLTKLGPKGISEVLALASHEDQRVRLAVVSCLQRVATPDTIRRLAELLDDEDYQVQSHAVFAVRWIAGTQPPALLAAMEDRPEAIRISVARAIAGFSRSMRTGGFTNELFLPEEEVLDELPSTLEHFRNPKVTRGQSHVPPEYDARSAALVALGVLGSDEAKALVAKTLDDDETPAVRKTAIHVLRFLGEDVPHDQRRPDDIPGQPPHPTDEIEPAERGEAKAIDEQVDRLIKGAGKLISTNPERGIRSLRAEVERIERLVDLDPAHRLALVSKIDAAIDRLQGWVDRRSRWRTRVQEAITEAEQLAKTDPQAAARRLYRVDGVASNAIEMLFIDINYFYSNPDYYALSAKYEALADKLDPEREVSRRMGSQRWTAMVQEALNEAMTEIRKHSGDSRGDSLDRRFRTVGNLFDRCRSLASEIEDEHVLSETTRRIDDAERLLADAVRWGFHNPVVLDSYDASDRFASGPLAWAIASPGFVLMSQRKAGGGPLDLWRAGEPVEGGELLGLRRLGRIPDAGWSFMSDSKVGVQIASAAGVNGETLTLRISDYDFLKNGAEPQSRDVKWQLKPPIRADRARSAVVHAGTSYRVEKGDKAKPSVIVSLFLRLIDREAPERSQLIFVRSPDGGDTWPGPPVLVADDVRWPGQALRPISFHPLNLASDYANRDNPDHFICQAMDEDNRAVFYRTHDGGDRWTKEIILLPDPDTRRSVPGIPLASPNPSLSLVYAIPTGDAAPGTYRLCHAWANPDARSWGGATTIASNLVLSDQQLFTIRASTGGGVTAVTCPVAGDGPDDSHVNLLLSIDGPRHRTWRTIGLDEQLGGRVGLTALRAWSRHRVFLAAEVENPARDKNRHQLIVQEISPIALESPAIE